MPIIYLSPKLNGLLNNERKDYKNNSLATIVENDFIPSNISWKRVNYTFSLIILITAFVMSRIYY